MSPVLIVAIVAVAGVWIFTFALCRAAGRATPRPPAGPHVRVRQSREQAGVVEFLPTKSDEN